MLTASHQGKRQRCVGTWSTMTAGKMTQQRLDTPCLVYAKEVSKRPRDSKPRSLADCKLRGKLWALIKRQLSYPLCHNENQKWCCVCYFKLNTLLWKAVPTGPPTFVQRNSFLNELPRSIAWKPIDLGEQQAGAILKLSVPARADRL